MTPEVWRSLHVALKEEPKHAICGTGFLDAAGNGRLSAMASQGAESGPPTSVIIPTYNRAALVVRAVRSALAATSPGDEVIVVDDGSTDNTRESLASFADQIRYIKIANGGAGRARNRGVADARFPLVAFLDSDDEWTTDRLLLGRRLLAARPDVLFCFSDFGLRREGKPDRTRGLGRWHGAQRSWEDILGPSTWYSEIAMLPPGRADMRVHFGSLYTSLLEAPYATTITLLVRREMAGEALRFAEDINICEDWECIARLASVGKAAYIDAETAWQWDHKTNRLSRANDFELAAARSAMTERIWGSDAQFLERNGERVSQVLIDQRLTMARWLLRRGRPREARDLLQFVKEKPALYEVLARVPGPILRGLFAARSFIRHRQEPRPTS